MKGNAPVKGDLEGHSWLMSQLSPLAKNKKGHYR